MGSASHRNLYWNGTYERCLVTSEDDGMDFRVIPLQQDDLLDVMLCEHDLSTSPLRVYPPSR